MRNLTIIIAFVLLSSVGWGQTTQIDGNAGGTSEVNMYTTTYVSQAFTNTNSCTLNSCKFNLYETGTAPGTIQARIYNLTGTYGTSGKPDGAAIATSDNITASTISSSAEWVTFTFSGANKITLSSTTYYCVAVVYTSGTNTTNTIICLRGGTHNGNRALGTDGTTWSTSSLDINFYVYADDAAPATTDTPLLQIMY